MFNKPIEEMDFKELRSAVQALFDAFAKQSREYADLLENLDFDNLSPGLKKSIVSAGSSETAIDQTADMITMSATTNFDLSNVTEDDEVDDVSDMTDSDRIYYISEYDGDGNELGRTYYCYSNISGSWIPMQGNSIYSLFRQTSKGFQFIGNVRIDGSMIVDGTISAEKLKTLIAEVASTLYIGGKAHEGTGKIVLSDNVYIQVIESGVVGANGIGISAAKIKLGGDGCTVDFTGSSVSGLGLPLVFS